MKLLIILLITALSILPLYAEKEGSPYSYLGITDENFPIIDGSDSTTPLRRIMAFRILGYDYIWKFEGFRHPNDDIKVVRLTPYSEGEEIFKKLYSSNTHSSFLNLIDGRVELIITARSISRDERVYANEKGVALTEKPIAKDALAFLVNPANPVNNLTTAQIQGIYTGAITNWEEVGGLDAEIVPYVRNSNSGSQEKFETTIMAGLTIKQCPVFYVGFDMLSPYRQIEGDTMGIAFSPFYYFSVIVGRESTKAIGVDGVSMTKDNIINETYPYITDVYAAVRSDVDKASTAYTLFEFLTTPAGQSIVAESGYVPISNTVGINNLKGRPTSTYYTDLQGMVYDEAPPGVSVKTDVYENGKKTSKKILDR